MIIFCKSKDDGMSSKLTINWIETWPNCFKFLSWPQEQHPFILLEPNSYFQSGVVGNKYHMIFIIVVHVPWIKIMDCLGSLCHNFSGYQYIACTTISVAMKATVLLRSSWSLTWCVLRNEGLGICHRRGCSDMDSWSHWWMLGLVRVWCLGEIIIPSTSGS